MHLYTGIAQIADVAVQLVPRGQITDEGPEAHSLDNPLETQLGTYLIQPSPSHDLAKKVQIVVKSVHIRCVTKLVVVLLILVQVRKKRG